MRNLKRVLTMVMAVAMMMSLMVVGAGAAFPDQDKIVNTEAVNMAVALGIIKGRDNGNFDPTANVTRAEMSKMICIVLNGGKDIPQGNKLQPTFSDIKGHWAEGYIEYCNSFGIVAGMGDGTFAPDATVTTTQAAKMLLVALGFDAKHESFNGLNWAITINGRAAQKNLYKGLGLDIHAPLTRDNAAQMIWNALQAVEVEYYYSLTTNDKGDLVNMQILRDKTHPIVGQKATLISMKYDSRESIDTMDGFSYNSTKKEWTYNFGADSFKSKQDFTHLFGLNTKVVYQNNTAQDVYGMFAQDSAVLYTGLAADIKADTTGSVKIDGKSYKLDDATKNNSTLETMEFGTGTASTVGALDPYAKVSVVDLDGNGKIDTVVATPYAAATVTYVGNKNVNFSNNTIANSLKFEDATIVDGLKKDDHVMIMAGANTATGKDTVAKLTEVTGTLKATKSGEVRLDNTWYTIAGVTGGIVDESEFNMNDKYTLYTVGSYVFYKSEGENKSVADVAYISAVDYGLGVTAKIYFADGTNASVSLDDMYDDEGNDLSIGDIDDAKDQLANQMVTYSKDGSSYDVTLLGANNKLGATDYELAVKAATATSKLTAATTTQAGKFQVGGTAAANTYAIDDTAVFFIQQGDKVKVVTGKEAKGYKTDIVAEITGNIAGANEAGVLYKTKNGVNTALAGFIVATGTDLPSNIGKADNYAVALSDASKTKVDGTTYFEYTIWNGKEAVVVLEKGSSTVVVEGSIINYTDGGDGKVSDVKLVSGLSGTKGFFAVAGINDNEYSLVAADSGDNSITSDQTVTGTIYSTKDTVVLYVDTDRDEGSAGGIVQLASPNDADDKYYTNVYVFDKDNDEEAELIVVETNNQWYF